MYTVKNLSGESKLTMHEMPNQMPNLPTGKVLVCAVNKGLGDELVVCESLQDMQVVYKSHLMGKSLSIKWYIADEISDELQILTISPKI